MEKNIQLGDKVSRILQVILFFSLPALSLFLCRNTDKWIMIVSLVLAFGISFFLVRYIFKNIFENINVVNLIFSFLVSDYILFYYYSYHKILPFRNNYYSFADWKLTILTILSMFALTIIVYFLWKKLFPAVKKFFKSLTKFEKIFLIVMFFGTLIVTIVLFNKTTAYYYAKDIYWDILYTSDSSANYIYDSYFNINSPMNEPGKQPLFGIFALPFAVVSKFLSQIFFFIPNGYAIFSVTVQIFAMAVAWLMLIRLLNLKENSKWELLLLLVCSFTTISFALILEQYLLSLFYLILIIYSYYNMKSEVNYSYIAGVGTLLTSGIMLPFVSKTVKPQKCLLNLLKCFVAGVIITIIFGQLPFIFDFFESVFNNLNSFGGKDFTFADKFIQFLNFVKGIFVAIPAEAMPTIAVGLEHLSYYLTEVKEYSILGIIILVICFISFIINRKNKMAIISFAWIVFSFLLLCVIGWGTQENGLNLYSLYFSWAYIILVYLFFTRIISNDLIRRFLIVILAIVLLYFNIPEFINIIRFGIINYPL